MKPLIEKIKLFFPKNQGNQLTSVRNEALTKIRLELLKGKTWRYLRYLHARNALSMVSDWNSIVIIGGGYGLAEIALALEYPNKSFHLTDHGGASHSFKHARHFEEVFELKNITFGQLNILEESKEKYDVVYSVEVLEHIEDDEKAAYNMRKIANKYVFCLVPFAEDKVNNNLKRRKYVLEKFEHFVAGYDEKTLTRLFPNPIVVNGCYWLDAGFIFRSKLTEMDISTIEIEYDQLLSEAKNDIRNYAQKSDKEALGIWVLSDVRSYRSKYLKL